KRKRLCLVEARNDDGDFDAIENTRCSIEGRVERLRRHRARNGWRRVEDETRGGGANDVDAMNAGVEHAAHERRAVDGDGAVAVVPEGAQCEDFECRVFQIRARQKNVAPVVDEVSADELLFFRAEGRSAVVEHAAVGGDATQRAYGGR